MFDDVERDPLDARLRLGEVLRPGVPLPVFGLLRFGIALEDAVEHPIECLAFEVDIGETTLIKNLDGRVVVERLVDGVGIDVVPEGSAGVSRLLLDRRPREADVERIGKRRPHVAR